MLMHQMFDIIPCYANMEKLLDEAPGEEKINLFNAHHKVENMWEYFVNERGSNFNKAMEDLDGIGGDVAAQDVPWEERCSVVIDVGGGKGRFIFVCKCRRRMV
jgi:hypothetical protein